MKKSIWSDGMMGLVVGDALGVPVQFVPREELQNSPVTGMEGFGTYNMPAGTWSDDSSMALATFDSIHVQGKVDAKDVMERFLLWEFSGMYTPFWEAFDEGMTCSTAIYAYRRERDVKTCGLKGEHSNGNGSLMRILPVCIYGYEKGISDEEAIGLVHEISGLTHNHLRSRMCCGFYYFCVKSILEGIHGATVSGPALSELLQRGVDRARAFYGESLDMKNLLEMAHLKRLFELDEFQKVSEEEIRSSGYVVDTLEAAVWCLITTDSFKECLLKAVNLGDDTDTVGAVAGGLAGLYYGYDEIPEEWLAVIQKREWLEDMFSKADNGFTVCEHPIADIHMHVIPGVDDGSVSMEMSMEMLRSSYRQGVRTVFCTSHGGVYYEDDRDEVKGQFKQLVSKCATEMPDLKLCLGAEVYMPPSEMDNVLVLLDMGLMPTLAGTKYVLAEYVDGFYLDYEDICDSVKRLKKAGYIPIIAHVERYYTVIPDMEAAKKLHDLGCYFQMNAYSVAEESEAEVRERAAELLDAGLVDFIGSDAHRMNHRPPMVINGVRELYRKYDKEYVDRIVYKNVEELILGEM